GLFVNSYILAITLIATWVSKVDVFSASYVISGIAVATIFVTVLVMRLLLLACEVLQGRHETGPSIVNLLALISMVLVILVGLLFTLPFAINAFDVNLGTWYWKVTVSLLVLAAMSLSVYVLLTWHFREEILRSAPGRTGLF